MREEEFYTKYVDFLFENVMKLDNKSILFVSLSHNEKLEKIINDMGKSYGIKKIHFEYSNKIEKNKFLLNHSIDEIENCDLFNTRMWNKYAMMGAHFLIILDYFLYDDKVDSAKIFKANMVAFKSSSLYNFLVSCNKVKWTGTFIPNREWIELFDKDKSDEEIYLMFNNIYMLDEDFEIFKERISKNTLNLNLNHFEKIRIINSLGTDLEVDVSKSKWVSIFDFDVMEKNVLPNYPSYEIYTSPNCFKTKGIVYGSKPIIYNNNIIDKYYFKFVDGKIVDYGSEIGYIYLKEIINIDEGSKRLGEIAIVELDNPIAKIDKIFYTTLLDENSRCHIALGNGFNYTYQASSDKEKYELGLNHSKIHIDFMIGTNDTKIYGYKEDKEILIYESGKFIFS